MEAQLVMRDAHVHVRARGSQPQYPHRFTVPPDKAVWSHRCDGYSPVEFTHPVVLENDATVKVGGWADPRDPAEVDWSERVSYEVSVG